MTFLTFLFIALILADLAFLVRIMYDYLNGTIDGYVAVIFGALVGIILIFILTTGHLFYDKLKAASHNHDNVTSSITQSSGPVFFQHTT